MSSEAYTWEEVMFGIDVRNEGTRKAQHQKEVEEKQAEEASAAGWWSLGLSILGGALLGPVGYFLGKQVGTYGADLGWFGGEYSDWEESYMEEGKFNVEGAKEWNKSLDKAAKDQTTAQLLGSVLDLGKMYIQGGGFTAAPGKLDLTTFGSGEDAWTVFSEESKIPGLGWDMPGKQLPVGQSAWDPTRGWFDNLGQVYKKGTSVYAKDQSISTIEGLGKEVYAAQQKAKEAKKG